MKKSSKYRTTTEKPNPLLWESTLFIQDVGSSDYGSYKCVATNVLGSDEHTIVLDVKSHPDPPVDLHSTGVTYKSVTLAWQPGFDGGFAQAYRLRIMKTGSQHYFYVEVNPSDATTYEVADLQPSTEYTFHIMAYNKKGESNYTSTPVKATTASKYFSSMFWNRLLSSGLEPVFSNTEKSFIASCYKHLSTNIKIKIII